MATTPAALRVRDSKRTSGPRPTFAPQRRAAFLPYASEH
ncbi:hypothetical protein [Streptomyces sp. KMM 9044]